MVPSTNQPALWLALAVYRALSQQAARSSGSSSLISKKGRGAALRQWSSTGGGEMQLLRPFSPAASAAGSATTANASVPFSPASRHAFSCFSPSGDWSEPSLRSKSHHGDYRRSFDWSFSSRNRGFASAALPSPQPSTTTATTASEEEAPPSLDETASSKRPASTLAAPSLPSSSSSPSQTAAGSSAAAIPQQPTADLCDFALSELDTTRSKIESATRSTYRPQSWLQKAAGAATAAAAATASFAAAAVSAPARVASFFATKSKQERRAVYAGWWGHAKAEARHYWAGTKLLWAEVKIASRLVAAAARGRALTRRERRQLTRTVADVFRLVPVAVFLVVPFMEFLLPIALKLFPNMLPSTFETALQREEALKRRVKAKLEVARFLQDTVAELAKDMKNSSRASGATQASAAELYAFMKRVRGGEPVSAAEVTRFASLFSDELTLDNLDRTQLASLCRFAGIQPFGTDAFLASRLRSHLARIKADDRAIRDEGLGSLSDDELRSACRARGMRAPFGEGARLYMERQMEDWLDLSLARQLPSSLLLLSRAFTVTAPFVSPQKKAELSSAEAAGAAAAAAGAPSSAAAAAAAAAVSTAVLPALTIPAAAATPTSADDVARLRETLGVLPDEAIEAASLEAAAAAGTAEGAAAADKAVALERKLESLRREEELIEEEAKDAAAAFGGAGGPDGGAAASIAAAEASALDASRLIAASNAAATSAAAAAAAGSSGASATATATAGAAAGAGTAPHQTPIPPPSIDTAADALAAGAAAAVVKEAAAAAALPSSVSEPPVDFDFVGGESAEERAAHRAAAKEARMRKVLSALAALASTSGVAAERGEFMDLVKKEVDRLNAEAAARGAPSLVFRSSGAAVAERPRGGGLLEADTSAANLGAARLSGRVPAILARIERELDAVDARIGERMHVLDEDNDGVISEEELKRALGFLRESLGEDELRTLLERLQRAKVVEGGGAGSGSGSSGSSSSETLAPFPGETGGAVAADSSSSSSSATPLAAATAASGFDVAHLMQLAAEESKGDDGAENAEKKV